MRKPNNYHNQSLFWDPIILKTMDNRYVEEPAAAVSRSREPEWYNIMEGDAESLTVLQTCVEVLRAVISL